MSETPRIELGDRQHEELLFFTEGTLHDIRDAKAIQQQGAVGAVSILGALLALAEKLHTPLLCVKLVLCGLVIVVGMAGILYVRKQQQRLVNFRKRKWEIYNKHFTLDLERIIGHRTTKDDPDQFSLWGDLVPLWTTLLAAAAVIVCVWILVAA